MSDMCWLGSPSDPQNEENWDVLPEGEWHHRVMAAMRNLAYAILDYQHLHKHPHSLIVIPTGDAAYRDVPAGNPSTSHYDFPGGSPAARGANFPDSSGSTIIIP